MVELGDLLSAVFAEIGKNRFLISFNQESRR